MSAEHLTPDGVPVPGGRAFEFALDRPIPPYLIAVAVGDIAFRPVGAGNSQRTGVFAEPSVLDRAAYEFADLDRMLARRGGPVRPVPVGPLRHPGDAAILPVWRDGEPAPDVRLADRPCRRPIAHLARRARTGALLVRQPGDERDVARLLAERRVHDLLREPHHGAAVRTGAGSDARHDRTPGAPGGARSLSRDTPGKPRCTPTSQGQDPDAALSAVPYGKGAAFLRMLELHVGRERFDAWLRSYFERHAFGSMTTPQFVEDLRATLLGQRCRPRARAAHPRVALRAGPPRRTTRRPRPRPSNGLRRRHAALQTAHPRHRCRPKAGRHSNGSDSWRRCPSD